ncbi:MAG TPA: tetratricopeptide repeat protein [Casimicrobiaceae bacterium]|nr:tetratricopeptide repeat protein [Casimicrobiaceae bacterium]
MQRYGVRDVEKLLRLPRSTIRSLIAAGFVSPTRGPRSAWQFSFQDLIVLRTAQALADANVPQRRITRSVKELRRHLPETMPLSGLSISAVADRVVVREGGSRWQAESGQYLLEFEGDPANGSLSVIERQPDLPDERPVAPVRLRDAQSWFEHAVVLEKDDEEAACVAYQRAIAADPALLDARINLGRLLHETGRLARAEQVYRDALLGCGSDSVLLYNLGVLLEDMKRGSEALKAYQAALALDDRFADCHYNLALVYETLGRRKEAIQHMARYRALQREAK